MTTVMAQANSEIAFTKKFGKFCDLPVLQSAILTQLAITHENPCFRKWKIDIRQRTGNRLIKTITLQSKVNVYGRGAVELLKQLCGLKSENNLIKIIKLSRLAVPTDFRVPNA
jgi:hypothetical protein